MNRFRSWKQGVKPAVKSSVSSWQRVSTTVSLSAIVFFLLVLSSFPEYSYQMLTSGLHHWPTAFYSLLGNMRISVGTSSILITALYSVFTGIAVTHLGIQFGNSQIDGKGLLSLGPGLLATGCISCGAGVLGLLGFAGAATLLPLKGDLVKIVGILLLLYFLGKAGDPELCRIN